MPQPEELIQQGELAEREGRRDEARRLFEDALHGCAGVVSAASHLSPAVRAHSRAR